VEELKELKVGEKFKYLSQEYEIVDITDSGVMIQRVKRLDNELAIFVKFNSERFYKVFKEFNIENLEIPDVEDGDDEGLDVELVKMNEETKEWESDPYLKFLFMLQKSNTKLENRKEVTAYLKEELLKDDELKFYRRLVMELWLRRAGLIAFDRDILYKAIEKVKRRPESYSSLEIVNNLLKQVDKHLNRGEPLTLKEAKELVKYLPYEAEDIVVLMLDGFDTGDELWLTDLTVEKLLKETSHIAEQSKGGSIKEPDNVYNKDSKIKIARIKNFKKEIEEMGLESLSDKTVAEMLKALEEEADKRGLFEDEESEETEDEGLEEELDDDEDDEEIEEEAEDEDFEPYTKEELEELELDELIEIAEEDFELSVPKKAKKAKVIKMILDAQEEEPEEEDIEDEDEEELEMPDFESMSLRELRKEAKEEGIDIKGLSKDELIEELKALYEE